MKFAHRPATWLCFIALAPLAAGCRTTGPTARRPSVRRDACAERLHDISGHLLLYYAQHRKLPAALADLGPAGGLPDRPIMCPASGKPYVYDPRGASVSNRAGRLVLCDPGPSHSGMRWGVLVDEAAGGGQMTARVVLVAEKDLVRDTSASRSVSMSVIMDSREVWGA